MSDLTDERVAQLSSPELTWHREPTRAECIELAVEVRRRRSALAADRERVQSVVLAAIEEYAGALGAVPMGQWAGTVDAIATRAAEQLATVRPVLTDDERKQLEHHIRDHRVTCSYSCSIIERLMNRATAVVGLSDADQIDLGQARHYLAASTGWNAFPVPDDAAKCLPVVARWLALLDRLLGASK